MTRRVVALLFLAQCTAPTHTSNTIPATPLGRFATEWLTLTVTPDSAAIVAFTRAHQGTLAFSPSELDSTVADMRGFTGALGPLTPLRTASSTDSVLVVMVRSG